MAQPRIAQGMPRRPVGKKSLRAYAAGGAIDEYGNDLTRSNQMGAAAERMRQDRLASASIEPAPVKPTTVEQSAAPKPPAADPSADTATPVGNLAMRDMNALGTVNPVGSGLGAGASYGWSTLTSAEKSAMAGLNPNAPGPTYQADGQMTKRSLAELSPMSARRAPAANLMQPVDSLFPVRRGIAAFADGGAIKETPEQLMARMAAKYGAPAGGSSAPAPEPTPTAEVAPAPAAKPKNIFGLMRGRKEQIDKAAGYAGGGKIKETPDELMARMAAKYGAPGAGVRNEEPAPAVQPVPVPAAKPKNIFGLMKGRKEQLDREIERQTNGYANGGKIKGPGTPKSDSIRGLVRETREPIKVSTGERILSAEQDAMLEQLASRQGFGSLNEMLEAGTGKSVGPTIAVGKKRSLRDLAPRFATGGVIDPERDYSLPEGRPRNAAPATPTSSASGPLPVDIPPAVDPAAGTVQLPEMTTPGSPTSAPAASTPTATSDASPPARPMSLKDLAGRISAPALIDEAQQSMGLSDAGSSVLERGNRSIRSLATNPAIREKLNTAHALLGDGVSYGRTTGADGKPQALISGTTPSQPQYVGADGEPTNDWTQTDRYQQAMGVNARMSNLADQMKRDRMERDAYDPEITNPRVRADARQYLADTERRAALQGEAQGRVLENRIKQTRLASDTRLGGLQSAYLAESDPVRKEEIGQQIRGLTGRSAADSGRVTLSQARENFEIDAARKAVSGLSPEEIRRRTAKQTNTGRENPDFDPALERALTLSGRRKIGADDHFDQRMQQESPPAGNDGDQMTRFRMDPAMKGHRLGQQTEKGYEVLDNAGKLVGHYR